MNNIISNMIGLPIDDVSIIDSMTPDNTIIDMNNLSFPADKDKQNNAALIYIRNMNITASFCFDKCDYETRAWYVLSYMTKINLEIDMKCLTETWICILAKGYIDIKLLGCQCIFSDDELEKFCNDNAEYIYELRRFLISIPLVSMDFFRNDLISKGNDTVDLDELDVSVYPKTSFAGLNISGYVNIIKCPVTLTVQQAITDIEPVWYTHYFDQKMNNYYGFLISSFPYIDMYNMLMPGNDAIRETFIEELDKMLSGETPDQSNE